MKSLLIVGAGGYGHLVREIAESKGYERIAFLDDNNPNAIGATKEAAKYTDYEYAIVAIGEPEIREYLFQIVSKTHKMVSLIHERAVISPSAMIGDSVVIEANAVVGANACVGKGTYINACAVVGHDAKVGDFCQIDCNSAVATNAIVPDKTKVESCTLYK